MIRITRTAEPVGLAAKRTAQLQTVGAVQPSRESAHREAYNSVKRELVAMQHGKCCYCECRTRMNFNDVEHYRPFSQYWWLAWTWENLLFACALCNRSGKNDHFPLAAGSTKLPFGASPPGEETPLFLDPSHPSFDRRTHIRFVQMNPKDRWMPIGLTPEGQETLRILRHGAMWADDYLDDWGHHVKHKVTPAIERLRLAQHRDDFEDAWRGECQALLHEEVELHALSEDVLRHTFPSLAFPDPPAR